MKKLLALTLGALSAFSLMSCNKKAVPDFVVPEQFDTETPVTVKFWHTMGKEKGQKILDAAIAQFQELYPNVTIESNQVGDYDAVKSTIIQNLGAQDWPTMAYCYPDHVAAYNEAEIAVPLDDLINNAKYGLDGSEVSFKVGKENIHPAFLKEGSEAFQDKKTYTLPFLKSTEVLYYNKNFFEEKGLTVPTTWDEVWETCKKIKEIDPMSTPLGIDSEGNLFISLAKQNNYGYTAAVEDVEGRFLFNNPEMKTLLKGFRENYNKGYFMTKITNQNSYTNKNFTDTTADNRVYMTIGSTGGATYQAQKDGEFETGISMYPQSNKDNMNVMSQGPSFCFFKKENNQEVLAAWLFAQFLLKDEIQYQFSTQQGYIPVTKSATNKKEFQDFLAQAKGDKKHIAALAEKQAIEQLDYYFTSPVFVGSADARTQVEALIGRLLTTEGVTDVNGFFDREFKKALDECLYQVS